MELLEGDLEISLYPAVWRDGTNSPCVYNTGRAGLGARSEPVQCRDPLGQRLHCLCPAAGAESEGKTPLEMAKWKSTLQQTAEQLNTRLCVHFMQFFVSILNFSEQLTIKLLSFPAVRYK